MPADSQTYDKKRDPSKQSLSSSGDLEPEILAQQVDPTAGLQRAIAARPSRLEPADVLTLQRIIGNSSIQRLLSEGRQADGKAWGSEESGTAREATTGRLDPVSYSASQSVVQRGWVESLRRGARMYLGMNDEGASYARQLMEWRILGLGADFVRRGGDWGRFMAARPEIQRAMATKFAALVQGFAAAGPGSGTFTDSITGVRLNELESMRLTLHGCHRIDISGSYEVTEEASRATEEGSTRARTMAPPRPRPPRAPTTYRVTLSDVRFVWVDRADLHPGTTTELDTGEQVDDRQFTAAGWDYDIRIHFSMPRTSTWLVSRGQATHRRGWPPVTGAPAAGFRG